MTTTTITIKKETVHRLVKDIQQLIHSPLIDQNIYYQHHDTDMLKGYCMIIGSEDTCYFGGYYFFELDYPTDYPYSPPKVTFRTHGKNIRFNPNLYTNGKVCVSLLNTWRGDQWSSCQTISSVLLTLSTLFSNNPLENEPLLGGTSDINKEIKIYNEIITYYNIDIAICSMIQKTSGIYLDFFDIFYTFMISAFNKNRPYILQLLEQKIQEQQEQQEYIINSRFYDLDNISINYMELLQKYNTLV